MSFKKKLVAVAAVVAMAAGALYASNLEMSGEESGRLSWFGNKDTVYFWYADESLSSYLNSAAVAFGEEKGVRVIPILAEESEFLEAINKASLEEKQVPDAYLLSNDLLEKAYLAGLASEVDRTVCNEMNFPDAALSAVQYHHKLIGYPLFYETSVLVYNETYLREWAEQQAKKEIAGLDENGDALDEPEEVDENTEIDEELLAQKTEEHFAEALPLTVEDILNIANTYDAPEGVEGVLKWDVTDIFYNYWFVGEYMIVGGDAGDDESVVHVYSEDAIACLEAYKNLNQFFSIETDKISYEGVVQDFIDGKIMFTIATTDVIATLEQAKADGTLAYDYGVTIMPDVSVDLESRSMSVTNAVVINGYSEQKELANEFAAFLTCDYAGQLYERTGKAPANRNVNTDHGALQIFATEYADSIPLPKMMETGNYWLQLEVLFSKVWNGADVMEQVGDLAQQIDMQLNGRPET